MLLGKCSLSGRKIIWTKLQWTPKNVRLWGTSWLLQKLNTMIGLAAIKVLYPTVATEDPVKLKSPFKA
jgi:hypothetical protein